MCVPTVAFCDTRDNPRPDAAALEVKEKTSTPIEGWPGEAARSARRRHARLARGAAASASVRTSSLAGFAVHPNILDRALLKSPAFDRRKEARHSAIVLSDDERVNLRHLARQSANCGTLWMAFRGYGIQGDRDVERRLVCQARCGTRACADCSARIRERECGRVEGPWELFFTLTIPRERCTAADAWREIHGWIESLLRELRREVAIANDERPRAPGRRHDNHVDRWIEANSNITSDKKFDYAWVLEPHEDGYPHVHMVVNSAWVKYSFIRGLWEKATGAMSCWVYGERVYQVNGTCRYLSKYIAKSVLTIEILALMYRRRLWATSIKRPERADPEWFREEDVKTSDLIDQAEKGDDWSPEEGWKLIYGKSGCYGVWERDAPERKPVELMLGPDTMDVRNDPEKWAAEGDLAYKLDREVIQLINSEIMRKPDIYRQKDGTLTLCVKIR